MARIPRIGVQADETEWSASFGSMPSGTATDSPGQLDQAFDIATRNTETYTAPSNDSRAAQSTDSPAGFGPAGRGQPHP